MQRSASEYRDYARQAYGWARAANSIELRDGFLDLAETWMRAAMRAETGECDQLGSPHVAAAGIKRPESANPPNRLRLIVER